MLSLGLPKIYKGHGKLLNFQEIFIVVQNIRKKRQEIKMKLVWLCNKLQSKMEHLWNYGNCTQCDILVRLLDSKQRGPSLWLFSCVCFWLCIMCVHSHYLSLIVGRIKLESVQDAALRIGGKVKYTCNK